MSDKDKPKRNCGINGCSKHSKRKTKLPNGAEKSIVDAAVSQKGELTVIKRAGKIVILYRIAQGYAIFQQVDDEALSVELNNFCADVYERGRKAAAARARRN